MPGKGVVYFGIISYGVYLLHLLCTNAIPKLFYLLDLPPDGLQVITLTFALVTFVAGVGHRHFESILFAMRSRFVL